MTETTFFSWVGRLLERRRGQAQTAGRWPVLQIEVTSRCAQDCAFCPNQALASYWLRGDLPWEVYRDHIGPHLARFEVIYLQGWGEPLLHPHLWEMIGLAKTAGCRVGFTTCGELLDEENTGRLTDAGVDILSISFAGATQAVHESLRRGGHFRRLVANVENLAVRKTNGWANMPHLELHFLMMRPNLHELPAFVRLAAGLAADEVVATNLTYSAMPDLDALAVFGPQPETAHLTLVAEAEAEAQRLGLTFRAYPLVTNDNVLECDARPTETAFINQTGAVAPCVYLGMPVMGQIPRFVEGRICPLRPLSFGNVRDGLLAAWQGSPRRAFSRRFENRKAAGRSALLLAAVDGDALTLPALPEACRCCPKSLGV